MPSIIVYLLGVLDLIEPGLFPYQARDPMLVGWHTAGDFLLGLSYILVGLQCANLARLRRKKDAPVFLATYIMFGSFLAAGGLAQLAIATSRYVDIYLYAVIFKWVTALATLATVVIFYRYTVDFDRMRTAEEYEQELATRKRVEMALSLSIHGLILADPHGRIIYWNRGAEEMFGYPASYAVGQRLSLIVPPELRERHELGLARFRASGKSKMAGQPVEMEAVTREGARLPVEMTLSVFDREGLVLGAILRDITERRRIELARDALIEDLTRAKRALAAQVSEQSGGLGQVKTSLDHALDQITGLLSASGARPRAGREA